MTIDPNVVRLAGGIPVKVFNRLLWATDHDRHFAKPDEELGWIVDGPNTTRFLRQMAWYSDERLLQIPGIGVESVRIFREAYPRSRAIMPRLQRPDRPEDI